MKVFEIGVNADKKIEIPRLKTKVKTNPKWYIEFIYYNTKGERKLYKKTYTLNKAPFVHKGKPNLNNYKDRLTLGFKLVERLTAKLQTIEFNVDAGLFVEDKRDLPLTKYLNDWQKSLKKDIKFSTYNTYNQKLNVFKAYLEEFNKEDITLRQFTHHELDKFLDWLLINGRSKSTYNYYLERFSTFFKNYLIKFHNILSVDEDITTKIDFLKTPKYSDSNASYRDVGKAFKDLSEYNYYLGLMAKTIYYTLHRIDTITQLQYRDFDLNKGLIHIPSNKIKTSVKGTIRIHKNLLPILQEYASNNTINPNAYFFGYNDYTLSKKNHKQLNIKLFAINPTDRIVFTRYFQRFKNRKKGTDTTLFTPNHTLISFKHSGINYYKQYLTDDQIIKITAHTNTSILKTYSRQFDAVIDEDLFNSLP